MYDFILFRVVRGFNTPSSLDPNGVEEQVFAVIGRRTRVVTDFLHIESLLGHLHESQICPPPSLKAKEAHRDRPKEVVKGSDEQRKCGFKVDAIGSENDVRPGRDVIWNRLAPIQNRSSHGRLKVVESNVIFHQRKHWLLVGNMDGQVHFTPASNGEPNEATTSSEFHAKRGLSQ